MTDAKRDGIHAGYEADYQTRFITHGVVAQFNGPPDCPYPLYQEGSKPRARCRERDEWLEGWRIGRTLSARHQSELEALL